jgi:ABC-type transport system involved in Fe-S cluster assembly fused permease/ATPase subunit
MLVSLEESGLIYLEIIVRKINYNHLSFILSVKLTLIFGYEKYGFLPFAIGCSFVLISFVYFTLYPLSWKEMTEEEKEAYRFFNKLPNDWEVDKD